MNSFVRRRKTGWRQHEVMRNLPYKPKTIRPAGFLSIDTSKKAFEVISACGLQTERETGNGRKTNNVVDNKKRVGKRWCTYAVPFLLRPARRRLKQQNDCALVIIVAAVC
jgi:hypothetical protein